MKGGAASSANFWAVEIWGPIDMSLFSRAARPSRITLADSASNAGEWELAARYYQEALVRNPENPPIWIQYGHALKESGRLIPAEVAYRRAIEGAPAVADAHLHLGHVLKLQDRRDEAKAAYLRALALDPALHAARRELLGFGWLEEALADVQRAVISAIPRNGRKRRRPSLITLADQARDLGEWERAVRLYRKALGRNPRNAPIWVQLGHSLKERGELAEAEAAYRQAVAHDPSAADPQLQLGHALKLLGKTEEARAAYLRALALDPGIPHALSELEGLGWSGAKLWKLSSQPMLPGGPASGDDQQTFTQRSIASHAGENLKLHLDKPEGIGRLGEIPVRSRLFVEGWVLARAGVASIDVAIDGDHVTYAHYGTPRWDVAEANPGWPNAQNSGFMASIPVRLLPTGPHGVCVAIRDNSGNVREVEFSIHVAEDSEDDGLRRKISQAEVGQQNRILSGLGWHPEFCLMLSLGCGEAELPRARATLASLREQAYADWRVYIAAGRYRGKSESVCHQFDTPNHIQDRLGNLETLRDTLLDSFDDISDRVEILRATEVRPLSELFGRLGGSALFGLIAAGDELSNDALSEFAVSSGVNRDADFFYSDELRISPVTKAVESFLKPQWSPDLLLATNYIGRLWFAKMELIERIGATSDDLSQFGEYDLVLRATESSNSDSSHSRAPMPTRG
jgi:tetratricopeptide (TPR) repeat protein